MKRLVVTGPREATFEDVPTPACPPDGLLVRATHTAVSTGTELRVYRAIPVDEQGEFLHERVPFKLPTENGYSMVGEVLETGRDVTSFSPGDRVFAPAPHKQTATFPARLAVKLPDEIPSEQAVFLNILEVGHIALRRGRPELGTCVAIVGQGVIGLSALAFSRAFGLRTIAVDRSPERLEISRQMGADLALRADAPELSSTVAEFCGGEGADVVVEAASNWDAIRTAMTVCRPQGTVVVAARHTEQPNFNPVGHPFLGKKLTLLTSYGHEPDGGRWDRQHSIRLTCELLARGRLDIAPMITHRFSWQQLVEVYDRLDRGDPGLVGVVIQW